MRKYVGFVIFNVLKDRYMTGVKYQIFLMPKKNGGGAGQPV